MAVYGRFMLLGFIGSAVLLGLAATVGRLVSVPAMRTGALLAAALVTRHFRELPTGAAILAALGTNWARDAAPAPARPKDAPTG